MSRRAKVGRNAIGPFFGFDSDSTRILIDICPPSAPAAKGNVTLGPFTMSVKVLSFDEVNFPQGSIRPSILHIDDNRDCRELIKKTLQIGGLYQLASAEDGRSGLARAKELLPDLIVLDLRLPDMDGLDVLFQLGEDLLTRNIPVVMVSAEAHRDVIASCLAAGAVDYITKPFDLQHLWHVVALVANESTTARSAVNASAH